MAQVRQQPASAQRGSFLSHNRLYSAYLVRIWHSGSQQPWRASARNIHEEEESTFTSIEGLFAYLYRRSVAELAADPNEEKEQWGYDDHKKQAESTADEEKKI